MDTNRFPTLADLLAELETESVTEVVARRVEQVMDASPWDVGLTPEEITASAQWGPHSPGGEYLQIRAMVEAAYRLGVQDAQAMRSSRT